MAPKIIARALVIASALAVLMAAAPSAVPIAAADTPDGRWIVQLRAGARAVDVVARAPRAANGADLRPTHRFSRVFNGFAARLTAGQRSALLGDPSVLAVVPDVPVRSTGDPYALTDDEIQSGIERIGATSNPYRGAPEADLDVDIAVLDTGISPLETDIDPEDRELNIAGGYNCTDETQPEALRREPDSWKDSAGFGHGTHVSGIAAARDNGRGVEGVAQGARLWAIKVLNGNGNGFWSWVICGLDHVAGMREPADSSVPVIEVINMSLAAAGADDGNCGRDIADLLHQAVCRVAEEGITMVAAAGNAASNAANYVPGAYDELITVSAMADWNGLPANQPQGSRPDGCTRNDLDDALASFSNYGPDVDLIAPGVCVNSTLPPFSPAFKPRLGLMSGTSMATPHVAGAAALYYLAEQSAGRPRPTPEQVRAALVERGTNDWLVSTDRDSQHEPALSAADLTVTQGFEIGSSSQVVRVPVAGSGSIDVWIARLHGFDTPIDLDVTASTLPAGATASISGDPSVAPATEASLTVDVSSSTAVGAYDIEVTAQAGAVNRSITFSLVVYATSGDANGPYLRLLQGVEAGAIAIPVRAKWSAVSKAQRYELQRSIDGAPWTTIAKTYRPKFNTTAWPGTRVQLRMRAKVGGTWRAWHTGRSSVVIPYEPVAPVVLQGSWQFSPIARPYSEDPQSSSQAGATATLQFTGRSIAWITTKAPTRGRAKVILDGATIGTFDLYSSTNKYRRLVFARSWSAQGAHTIRIQVLGQPSGRPKVDLDALIVVAE